MGEAVLADVRTTMDLGLHYPSKVPMDEDPDLARARPRRKGTVEVLVDASFSPGDSYSISIRLHHLALRVPSAMGKPEAGPDVAFHGGGRAHSTGGGRAIWPFSPSVS